MITFLAILGAALGAASMLLHVIAPLTKSTVDDQVELVVDKVLSYLGQHSPADGTPANVEVEKVTAVPTTATVA